MLTSTHERRSHQALWGTGDHVTPPELGLKQFSLRHVAQVLQGGGLNAFARPSLCQNAVFPFAFRLQVIWLTYERSFQSIPPEAGIP